MSGDLDGHSFYLLSCRGAITFVSPGARQLRAPSKEGNVLVRYSSRQIFIVIW